MSRRDPGGGQPPPGGTADKALAPRWEGVPARTARLGSGVPMWVVMSLASSAPDMPWSNDVSEFMLCSFWAVLLALAVQFFLSFAGLRSRFIENVIALQWVVLPLSLVLAHADNRPNRIALNNNLFI